MTPPLPLAGEGSGVGATGGTLTLPSPAEAGEENEAWYCGFSLMT